MDLITIILYTIWVAVIVGLVLIGVWDLRKGETPYGIVPIFAAGFSVFLYLTSLF